VWEAIIARGSAVVAAAAAAALVAVLPAPGASAQSSCGWTVEISGAQANAAFPDQAARYWTAQLPIPPGFHLEVAGQFPHARYISYITYDPATRAIDGIHDTQIAPDAGSTNPFVAGADRTVANRAYRVYVVDGAPPASGRAQNTVYTDNGQSPPSQKTSPHTAFLIYRVYEADQGLDEMGGVGLPTISLVSDDGSQRQTLPDCPAHSLPSTQSLTDALAAAGSGAGNDSVPSVELGGQNPPTWIRYTNAVDGVANGVLNNPRTGTTWPTAQQTTNMLPSGGFYENVDNAYMTAFDSASYGDILVFHGKAPTTPQTFLPSDTTMGSGQLRYWSMCSNTSTTQYLGCIKDDDVKLDSQGYFTVVISTAANRPATANPSCGIEWLPKGPLPSAPIILRNMLPDPSFTQAIQDVPPGSNTEQQVLGPYYPTGTYFDHAANFDSFVNANGGCAGFSWPYASPPSTYRPPGLPGVG
jgi:hypothetical protein